MILDSVPSSLGVAAWRRKWSLHKCGKRPSSPAAGWRAWGERAEVVVPGLSPSCPSPAPSAQGAQTMLFLYVVYSSTPTGNQKVQLHKKRLFNTCLVKPLPFDLSNLVHLI